MAKRKITVTVDETLVDAVQRLGAESLSSVVNAALEREVDHRARAAVLQRLLSAWDTELGPVSAAATAFAAAVFDDLDGLDSGPSDRAVDGLDGGPSDRAGDGLDEVEAPGPKLNRPRGAV